MRPVTFGSQLFVPPPAGTVVAVGNFDGVHAGHRALIAEARRIAPEGAAVVACTFDPAPTAVLAPDRHQPRILRLGRRVERLGAAGIDAVVVEAFDAAFAARPAAWFVDEVLVGRLGARAVVVGYDFCFGRGREGDAAWLRRERPLLRTVELPACVRDGATVSSSRLRRLIAHGELDAASRLMGRPHLLEGRVVPGDQRGRTLGFPTANLECGVELLPPDGVYAVWVELPAASAEASPTVEAGVMNIGQRPTFSRPGGPVMEHRIEVHLLDRNRDLYGAWLTVALMAKIRGEQRFTSVDALVAQIRADVGEARARLGAPDAGVFG